jgi:hypothetical protein
MKILFPFFGGRVFMATPFENKTLEEIRELLLNAFQEKFNKTFRLLPKSFIKVISVVFSGVYITLYKMIGWLFLQIFPDTAYWGSVTILGISVRPLVKWGVLMGIGEPLSGSQWKGIGTVKVLHIGSVLVAGTQLKSDISGKLYLTDESVELEEDAALVPLTCSENGAGGNLDSGDTLSFVSPLGVVERSVAIAETTEYAVDDEPENQYRARVIQRFKTPPMGGALADYRIWSNEVPGVWNSYPQKDLTTPAGVLIWVAGRLDLFPHRIPDAALLRKVGDSCTYDPATGKANRKPVAAVIDPACNGSYTNINPISVMFFGVAVYGLTGIEADDFYEPCKEALDNYFMSREPYIRGLSDDNNKTNTVSRNSILSVVNQAAVSLKAEFSDVELLLSGEPIQSYDLSVGQLSEMSDLVIHGDNPGETA